MKSVKTMIKKKIKRTLYSNIIYKNKNIEPTIKEKVHNIIINKIHNKIYSKITGYYI